MGMLVTVDSIYLSGVIFFYFQMLNFILPAWKSILISLS